MNTWDEYLPSLITWFLLSQTPMKAINHSSVYIHASKWSSTQEHSGKIETWNIQSKQAVPLNISPSLAVSFLSPLTC